METSLRVLSQKHASTLTNIDFEGRQSEDRGGCTVFLCKSLILGNIITSYAFDFGSTLKIDLDFELGEYIVQL